MKRLMASSVLGLMSVGSFGLATAVKVNAVVPQSPTAAAAEQVLSTPTTVPAPPIVEATIPSSDEQLTAYTVYCESYTDGFTIVTCCADSYGNWACTAQ